MRIFDCVLTSCAICDTSSHWKYQNIPSFFNGVYCLRLLKICYYRFLTTSSWIVGLWFHPARNNLHTWPSSVCIDVCHTIASYQKAALNDWLEFAYNKSTCGKKKTIKVGRHIIASACRNGTEAIKDQRPFWFRWWVEQHVENTGANGFSFIWSCSWIVFLYNFL